MQSRRSFLAAIVAGLAGLLGALMPEKVIGFSQDGFKRVRKAVHKSEGTLPPVGRRTRRVQPSGPPRPKIGKTDATSTIDNTVTVSIWSGASSSTIADTGENVTAYNRFATVASGAWVKIERFPFGWEITAAEC